MRAGIVTVVKLLALFFLKETEETLAGDIYRSKVPLHEDIAG